ncbi:replication initiation protein [Kibdelosporangium aridum]|uniref:Replication initiation protein n=1 Tax=Kibdelosporangium aridum TaxID=2030 RepID=A0A428Z366_KIBAR|nr:replication initiator [Kibdelosporangium aridum]RSM80409.1 replication initiation protein [Kibdelosporangium aridum]
MTGVTSLEDRISNRVKAMDYRGWRAKVEQTGGCLNPVRMSGSWTVNDTTTGTLLAEHSGAIFAPCGNRRYTVCPACSERYAADAFHLVRAGLAGGSKDVPLSVADKPRVFATLTAPSFGPVHNRRTTRTGKVLPCACGAWHHPADPNIGTALEPDTYDYVGAVLWQANAGKLWHRFVITLRRKLAHAAGLTVRTFKEHARLSYAKVAENQRRGLVHFHAVIRVDGPNGPNDQTPNWITSAVLEDAITAAAQAVSLAIPRPDGTAFELEWGTQTDIRHIRPANAGEVEDANGEISEHRLAGYVAKYATKGTGKTEGPDRPIRSQLDIDHLHVSGHHRQIIQTAWDLGMLPQYEELNLHRWAHMLGFRGHFLTKSRAYSTTFKTIRGDRREWRRQDALERLGVTEETVTVVNSWIFTGIGYRDDAERALAHAISERQQQNRNAKRRADHEYIVGA